MKLEELSKEDLVLLLKNAYHKYRIAYIELLAMDMDLDKDEKEEAIKEYMSEILSEGIDEIILRNVGQDFD